MADITPPRLPIKLLRWFCKPEYLPDIEGDLLEMYATRLSQNHKTAGILLMKDVILLCRPGIIKPIRSIQNFNGMVQHNILISFRSFLRNRTAFFINLSGLSSGLACVLLILMWIADELSVDKFHENDKQLYQVMANYSSPNGVNTVAYTPSSLAKALATELPEVEYAVATNPFFDWFKGPGIISNAKHQMKAQGIFASEDFFNVFSYKLTEGRSESVFSDESGIIISERLAKTLFGNTGDAIGKVVEWSHRMDFGGPLHITGVFENIPSSSTTQFDIVFNYKKLLKGDTNSDKWNGNYAETCLVLRKGTDTDAFNKKIAPFLVSKEPTNPGTLFITQYSKKYLYGNFENGVQSGGRISYVKLFSLIAMFTLAVACINFVNLSTAQASTKLKQVGIKKALGVQRTALVTQFLSESIILAFVSLAIAIMITFLLLPNFSLLTNKDLSFNLTTTNMIYIGLLVLATGIASGFYPAFYLSAFKPVDILKGKIINHSFGEVMARKGLVIIQFTVSIIFIIGFMIVSQQVQFVQTRNLGYERENVITFQRQGKIDQNDYEAFMHELKNIPGVINASSMFGSILNKENSLHSGFSWPGQSPDTKAVLFPSPAISHDFIESLGIQLKEGRTFSSQYEGEDSKIVVNEAAVKMMGLKHPVGETISYGSQEKQIIGVVKDFHYGSLHSRLDPVFFMYGRARTDIFVRIHGAPDKIMLNRLEQVYSKFHPGYPLDFRFLDDSYQALYDSENRVSTLSKYFAVLATIISCLGLFGLATFTTERRTKEIGIRKVMGASSMTIVGLLAADLIKPVLFAIVVSIPLSYLIGKSWLDTFAYRIDLSWWFFIGAGVLALLITWVTVSVQAIKAARANPVDSLKAEG